MNTLRCTALSKSFDGLRAIDDLDLELRSSEITAIIGPNGAGKTTLINLFTGFLRPDAGQCFLGSLEITKLPTHRIAQQGLVRTFQELRLIRQVSVIDNVMVARPHQRGERLAGALSRFNVARQEEQNRADAMRHLSFVGIQEHAYDLAGQLSYGQQKLLTLACCLATEARTLLLDEPVAGVHPTMVTTILDLMRRLRAEGKQIVFIEHDISAVRDVADHVVVLDHGKVRAQGPPRDVLAKPEIMEAYVA